MAALMLAMMVLWPTAPARGQDASAKNDDLDSFWLGFGTSNVSQGQSFELGVHIDGAFRFGAFDSQFAEIGYTTTFVTYDVSVDGVTRQVSFRNTGPFVGYGVLIPLRKRQLGLRAMLAAVAFEEELADRRGAVVTEQNGTMLVVAGSFYFVLARAHEIGMRYDSFVSDKSTAESAFGVFYNFHIQ